MCEPALAPRAALHRLDLIEEELPLPALEALGEEALVFQLAARRLPIEVLERITRRPPSPRSGTDG